MKHIFSFLILTAGLLALTADPCGSQSEEALTGTIAFIRDGNIWLADADGSNQRQLTRDGNYTYPSWSPDGKYILCERHFEGYFDYGEEPGNSIFASVWLIDVENIKAKRISPPEERGEIEMNPTFSTDGRYVIYVRRGRIRYPESEILEMRGESYPDEEGADYLTAYDLQTGERTILETAGCGWEGTTFGNPCSIDGIRDIVYTESGDGVYFAFIRLKDGNIEEWVADDHFYGPPVRSHDGESIIFFNEGWENEQAIIEICSINIKNDNFYTLAKLSSPGNHASWDSWLRPALSPDDRHVLLVKIEENTSNIWSVDLETGEEYLLIENGSEPAWSP